MDTDAETHCQFVDTGTAPEFFIARGTVKREYLCGGIIRTYVCSQRSGVLIPIYAYIAHKTPLAAMAADTLRACERYEAEARRLGLNNVVGVH